MERFIETHDGERFDVVVVGGGITGGAVAYDAAARGLRVALVEKRDFGWATSAATSKLIHGGLRYLQNLEFGLVRESLRERRILENIAPNLVRPVAFLVPGYNDRRRNRWVLRAGLVLYDLLSLDKGCTWDRAQAVPHHRWLSREQVREMEPLVRTEGMTGGSLYYDCQSSNPERLTLAFVKSAVRFGARVANHARVDGFVRGSGGRVVGVRVSDLLGGEEGEVHGSVVVNCGGPWADILLGLADPGGGKHQIRRSEGIHILTRKLPCARAIVMWTPAGRHFFMVPWRGYQLIGTTDEEYVGNPDAYRVTREAIEGLIRDVNDSIGDGDLRYEDVRFAYGGLRPLVDEQTEGTYQSSRKYEIYDNGEDGLEGLVTVEGGKYTTSRHLAEQVGALIERKLGRRKGSSRTHRMRLAGCEIPDLAAFTSDLSSAHADVDPRTVELLGRDYGTESRSVLEIARTETGMGRVVDEEGQVLAAVAYAARREMARTLEDALLRRTGIGNTGHPGPEVLEEAGRVMAGELGWDAARLAEEIARTDAALRLP